MGIIMPFCRLLLFFASGLDGWIINTVCTKLAETWKKMLCLSLFSVKTSNASSEYQTRTFCKPLSRCQKLNWKPCACKLSLSTIHSQLNIPLWIRTRPYKGLALVLYVDMGSNGKGNIVECFIWWNAYVSDTFKILSLMFYEAFTNSSATYHKVFAPALSVASLWWKCNHLFNQRKIMLMCIL